MIKNGSILVPTDFSDCAAEAFRRACVLAEKLEASIQVLHVLEPVLAYEPDEISLSPVRELTRNMREVAQRKLAEIPESAPPKLNIETKILATNHPPHQAICDFARDLPADLIVMGRHGHRGAMEHLLIGSVAERVVRHAPCTVMVTRPHGILQQGENNDQN